MQFFPTIDSMVLVITHRCNLACKYCFVHQNPLDMSLQVATDAVDFLVKNNLDSKKELRVGFFGGEPLLRYNDIILPVIDYCKIKYPEQNFYFMITTNGVLLDEEKSKFFLNNNIHVLTSIDGNPLVQDYNRPFHNGQGSSAIVEKNLRKFIELGGEATFRSTIIPKTCIHLFDSYLYAQSLGYKAMFFITDSYAGTNNNNNNNKEEENKWNNNTKEALQEQLNLIALHWIEYFKNNNKPFISLRSVERHFKRIEKDLFRQEYGIPRLNYYTEGKCGYGHDHGCGVGINGDLYGCQEIITNEGKNNFFYIGNIYTGIENERRQALYDFFKAYPKTGDMNCNFCTASSICNGGCSSANYAMTGQLNHATSSHCFYLRYIYEISKKIVMELKDNPEFRKLYLDELDAKIHCQGCQECDNFE